MSETDRAQGLIERIQEDERLRGDLSDPAATALVAWATEQVQRAAADPQRSDEDLATLALAVRAAARAAAQAGDGPASEVLARAEAQLAQTGTAPADPAEAPVAAPAETAPATVAAVAEAVTETAADTAATVAQSAADRTDTARQRPQRPQSSYNRRRRPYRAGSSSGKTRKEG